MKNNLILIGMVLFGYSALVLSFAHASEIEGTLSTGGSQPQPTMSSGGGSGGGGMVAPSSGYYSGQPVNYQMSSQPINLNGTSTQPSTTVSQENKPATKNTSISYKPKNNYLAQVNIPTSTQYEDMLATNTDDFLDDSTTTSTMTSPTIDQPDLTVDQNENNTQPGMLDFFGISAWFWLIILILIILIIAILYMQSL